MPKFVGDILQTFTTKFIDFSEDQTAFKDSLFLHFLSSLCISNYHNSLILYTDPLGASIIEKLNFPYQKIKILDDWGINFFYPTPYKYIAKRMHSSDFIHVDNDVFIFSPFQDFDKILVQSFEGNALVKVLPRLSNFKIPHQYSFKYNYNPGVLGFKTNMEDFKLNYINMIVEYGTKNHDVLQKYYSTASTRGLIREFYVAIEECTLFEKCREIDLKPSFVLRRRHLAKTWATDDDYSRVLPFNQQDYYHLIGDLKQNTLLVQQIIQKLIKHNDNYLNLIATTAKNIYETDFSF